MSFARVNMTIEIVLGEEIRNAILRILSGECLFQRHSDSPRVFILSPWISDVEIEFSEFHISKETAKGDDSYLWDFNIKSINLAHVLLLLKLHGGADINIVTLPPFATNYSPSYLPRIKTLLDFLDEIGCNVLVNSKLHSKLILANDLALLGSFNLSNAALYDREEIGLSINDLDNLEKLENYCCRLVHQSQPFGFTAQLHYEGLFDGKGGPPSLAEGMTLEDYRVMLERWSMSEDGQRYRERIEFRRDHVTRGWLLDHMIKKAFNIESGGERYREFLDVVGEYDKCIESYSKDLNLFYLLSLRRLVSSSEGRACVSEFFGYKNNESVDSIIEFLNGKFARRTMPDLKLRVRSL